jgi:TonB family protein
MSPRSLLFSSNEETSRQIGQALIELDFSVDSCREIFAALEKLTTRRYEAVIADSCDGAEAAFLLKTARELKSTQSAFTVVLGDSEGLSADLTGATHVLRSPFISEKVKYDLLTCDVFLANMRSWLTPAESSRKAIGIEAVVDSKALGELEPRLVTTETQRVIEPSPIQSQILAEAGGFDPMEDVDASLPSHSDIQTLFANANAQAEASTKSGPIIPLLLCVGLGAAMLFTDYIFDEHPLWSRVVSASSNIGRDVEARAEALIHRGAHNRAKDEGQLPEAAQVRGRRSRSRNDTRIHVTEIYPNMPVQQPSLSTTELAGFTLTHEETPAAIGLELGNRPSPLFADPLFATPIFAAPLVAASAAVPESLHVGSRPPVAEYELPADVPTRLVRALLPVNLTGDLADKLLLEKTQPSYPALAVRSRLQGSVVLQALIGTDGMIRDLKLLSGPMLLGKAACEAVKQWKYKPYLLEGHAVEATTLVRVDFKLP